MGKNKVMVQKLIQVRRDDNTVSRTQVWNHVWQQAGIWSAILVTLLPELRGMLADVLAGYPWAVPLLIAMIKAVDMYYRATTTKPLK